MKVWNQVSHSRPRNFPNVMSNNKKIFFFTFDVFLRSNLHPTGDKKERREKREPIPAKKQLKLSTVEPASSL